LIWHTVVLLTILWLLPALFFASGFWALPGVNTHLTIGFALAYVAAVAFQGVLRRFFGHPELLSAFVVTATGLALVYLETLLMPVANYSRALVIAGTGVVAGGALAPSVIPRISRRLLLALTAVAVLAAAILVARRSFGNPSGRDPSRRSSTLATSHETLAATFYAGMLPPTGEPRVTGGAITPDPRGSGYLLVRGGGRLYRVFWDDTAALRIEPLGIRVPINNAEFEADVPKTGVDIEGFRVADILAQQTAEGARLFVSHHYWKRQEKCFVVKVSSHLLPRDPNGETVGDWKTIFESAPCLPLKRGRGAAFAGVQVGGNLADFGGGRLLLTVGDHQFDGWYGTPNYVGDRQAHYGKTLMLDIATGKSTVFTSGHRNAQGLEIDARGRVWETEHGPEGGDELNLLQQGKDYGWPNHTFGTEYGSVSWPLGADSSGSSRGADQSLRPVYAWVPSIGISELVAVRDTSFERWQGDLLVASLAARALWRVRVEDDRVVYAEPIDVGERIRDIAAGRGEFVLFTDQETIVRLIPVRTLDRGSELFAVSCGGCHDDDEHRIGPNLDGLFDRPIASAQGFEYSPALRQLGGRWTESRLQTYIARPDSLVPGTLMRFGGISDAAARRAIIEYLRTVQ
jgi:cytochrome c2